MNYTFPSDGCWFINTLRSAEVALDRRDEVDVEGGWKVGDP